MTKRSVVISLYIRRWWKKSSSCYLYCAIILNDPTLHFSRINMQIMLFILKNWAENSIICEQVFHRVWYWFTANYYDNQNLSKTHCILKAYRWKVKFDSILGPDYFLLVIKRYIINKQENELIINMHNSDNTGCINIVQCIIIRLLFSCFHFQIRRICTK